jgi:hypothetical protein
MPRDFVPCVYHERDLYNMRLDEFQRRCEVTELFTLSLLHTHEQVDIVSGDSHAFFIDPQPGDDEARTRLFDTFYAAMADLE